MTRKTLFDRRIASLPFRRRAPVSTSRLRWPASLHHPSMTMVGTNITATDKTTTTSTTSMARRYLSASSDHNTYRDEITYYLEHTLGFDSKLHGGILKAVESVYGKDLRVSHLEKLGLSTMRALADSVERELQKRGGWDKVPTISLRIRVPHHGFQFDVQWRLGESLFDVAKNNEEVMGEYMEGTCGGNMSCCTCQVYISQPEFQSYLPEPEQAELDMLDLAYEPRETSRLGCQIRLSEAMLDAPVQLEVELPAGVNDVWN